MFTESPPYSRWPPFATRFAACNSMPTFLSPCAYLDFCFSPTVNKDYFSWLSYGNWKKCLKRSCKVTKSDQGSSVCRAWVWIRKFYPLMCHLLDALLGYLIPLLLWERKAPTSPNNTVKKCYFDSWNSVGARNFLPEFPLFFILHHLLMAHPGGCRHGLKIDIHTTDLYQRFRDLCHFWNLRHRRQASLGGEHCLYFPGLPYEFLFCYKFDESMAKSHFNWVVTQPNASFLLQSQ